MPPKPKCLCGKCTRCKHREYMRRWYQRKTPEERRAWVSKRNKDLVRQRDRERAKEPKRRQAMREYGQRWNRENRHKKRAHVRVKRAVDKGLLKRGPCERADESCSGPIEAHHDDYEKSLEVRWLCASHHRRHHRDLT